MCDRLPARTLLITGLSCFAVSMYWLHNIEVNTAFWLILISVVVSRLGQSLINATLNATALRSLHSVGRLLEQAGASSELQSTGALHYLGRAVYARAYSLAFRDCFLIVTVLLFMLAFVPAWIMGRRKH